MATITQQKVIQSTNVEAFQLLLNQHSKELNAFATQTHVAVVQSTIYYVAVLFYKVEVHL